MSTGPVFRAALWFHVAAALYLALAPLNFVLCCDPDGAVALEVATADQRCQQCPDRDSDLREPHYAPTFTSDHCDCPCVDVPLTPDGDLARTPKTSDGGTDAPPLVLAMAPAPFLLPRLDLVVRDVAITPSPPPPAVPHLRSVVLVV